MATFSRSIEVEAPRDWLFHLMQDYDRRLELGEGLVEGVFARSMDQRLHTLKERLETMARSAAPRCTR